jgi:hypothetical protein
MTEDEVIRILTKYASSIGMPLPRIQNLADSLRRELSVEEVILKASEYATAGGVSPDDLQNPKYVAAALVTFEGNADVQVFTDLQGRYAMMSRSVNPTSLPSRAKEQSG